MRKRFIAVIICALMALTLGLVACGPEATTQYTVTVVNGTGGGTFDEGTDVTVTATVPEDKEFESWLSEGEVVSTANPYTFKVRKDITLTATFKDKSTQGGGSGGSGDGGDGPTGDLEELEDEVYYTVIADGGTIEGYESSTASVKSGETVTITAVVEGFFEFDAWLKDGEQYTEEESFEYKVESNVKFSTKIHPVSRYDLHLEGCTSSSEFTGGVEVVTVIADTKENYEFVNWTINNETVSEGSVYTFELTEETTVVANFRRINIHITAECEDENFEVILTADKEDPDSETYVEGDSITLEVKTRNGITLKQWKNADTGDMLSTDNPYTFNAEDDINIVAVMNTYYTVTVESGYLDADPDKTTDIYAEGVLCVAQPNEIEGKLFTGWTDGKTEGNVSLADVYRFEVTEDVTLTANYIENVGNTYVFEAENADLSDLKVSPGDAAGHKTQTWYDLDHGDPVLNASNKCSNDYSVSGITNGADNVVRWNINNDSEETAKGTLIFRCSSGSWKAWNESADIHMTPETNLFTVNGTPLVYDFVVKGYKQRDDAKGTSAYGMFADYLLGEIELQPGRNVIEMTYIQSSGAGAPNPDALKITTNAPLSWTPIPNDGAPTPEANRYFVKTYVFEGENADLSDLKVSPSNKQGLKTETWYDLDHGDPVLNASSKCSNNYSVSGISDSEGNIVRWVITNNGEAATATLILRCSSGLYKAWNESGDIHMTRTANSFTVNGKPVEYDDFTIKGYKQLPNVVGNSAYALFADYTLGEIQLQAGQNIIEMAYDRSSGTGAPNVDAIKLVTNASLTWTPVSNDGAPIPEADYNLPAAAAAASEVAIPDDRRYAL